MCKSNTPFKTAQRRRAQRRAEKTRARAKRRTLRERASRRGIWQPLVLVCWLLAVVGIAVSTRADSQPAAGVLLAASHFVVCPRRRRPKKEDDSRRRNVAASYSRFSSDELQDAKSIADQQRPCRERATRDGNQLPSELEFSDEGVSGARLKREGFDAMLAAAAAGLFGTLYVFDLSRLARESIISATTLRKLVYRYKVRVVSLTKGVDSNNQGWETLATILGLQHEHFLKTLSANVLRGLIGNLLDGLSVGDMAYGFGSVPVRGHKKRRRGRNQRPPKRYVIKDREAKWVRKIFFWFATERRAIQWIVRELNRHKARRDRRARGRKWGRAAVINLLRRTKYIGIWPWGEYRNQRDPDTGEIYQEPREEEEWKGWVRHLPELRIVEDEIFAETQRLLDENERKCAEFRDSEEGTFTGSPKDQSHPRHLLQRRVRCGECGAYLYVVSTRGLACPGARDGVCTCRTTLPRQLAEQLILGEIGRRVLDDPAWRKAVQDEAFRSWQTFQSEVPGELESVQAALREVERRISNLVDQIEEGNAPFDVRDRLESRRDERAQIVHQIEQYERQVARRPQVLTTEQIDEALRNLHGVLSSGTPAAAIALGNLIGDVVVLAVSRPGRKRPFLRGEFTLRAGHVVDAVNGIEPQENGMNSARQCDDGEKIVIDFVEPDPKYAVSDRVRELSDAGLANWEIAEQLQLRPSRVTLLYNFWYERRGLPAPERGNRPKRKRRETPLYKRIAAEAKQRWDAGDSESEIGRDFDTTQATVRKAIEWWHTSRDLAVPKFADRRKTQVELAASLYQAGCSITEIAEKKLKVTITTVRKMLAEWFTSKGEVRPDGRSRRRRSA
jgi:site-specific DNA recombinase